MIKPLSGMTILECGSYITVPYASMMLADMGATVIKVERNGGGDPFRRFNGGTYSPYFRSTNRNKKSVVIDLKKAEGKEIFKKLALTADLVIENNRPGVMEGLGVGYDELSATNPRLVYCSVTGFGADGPHRDRPAFDTVGQALSGLLSLSLDPQDPRLTGSAVGDGVTGLYACYASLSGLMQRERTGKGCRVETNMMAASMSFLEFWYVQYYASRQLPDMYQKSRVNLSFAMTASDGKMLIVHLSSLPKFWENLLKAMDVPEIGRDPRFADREKRVANYEELRLAIKPVFARKTRAHWMAALEASDVPFAPIYTFDEPESDAQVQHLGLIYQLKHDKVKNAEDSVTMQLKRPVWIDGQTGSEESVAPPLLGEHTHEVLKGLGYSDEDLERFLKAQIVEAYQEP